MKALRHLYEDIASVENLFRAAEATLARGLRFRGEGARFKFNMEEEVLKLHEQLRAGRYRHGKYRLFTVWDPKVRVIAAATVRDRVVHHAVHDVVEPRLDRMFIHDSYACRRGKGTHRAVDRAHGFLRACGYGLHLDVKSYFATIDHEILKGLLGRYVADESALGLLEQIVDSTDYLAAKDGPGASVTSMAGPAAAEVGQMELDFGSGVAGSSGTGGRIRGLPLGNLTSQFFANLYLNELDQYVKHRLKVRCYVRYMDDMLLFAEKKEQLQEWEEAIRSFARDRLRLELHPSGGPGPVSRGIGFLGFRLFPGYRKLKRASVTRFIRRMNAYTREYHALWPDREGQAVLLREIGQSTRSFHAHALNADTYRIRKRLYDRFPIVNQYGLPGMRGRWRGGVSGSVRRGSRLRTRRDGRDGHAADCGEGVRPEQVALAEGRQVPVRSAVSAGRASHGQSAGHPGRPGRGGNNGERGREATDAGGGGPGSGSVAISASACAGLPVDESRLVVFLREERDGSREDAGRLDQER
jgi:hypothetical protein